MAIRLDLNLHSGNAAFDPATSDPAQEIARLLRALADQIEDGREGPFNLHDVNGQPAGAAHLEIWDDENPDA